MGVTAACLLGAVRAPGSEMWACLLSPRDRADVQLQPRLSGQREDRVPVRGLQLQRFPRGQAQGRSLAALPSAFHVHLGTRPFQSQGASPKWTCCLDWQEGEDGSGGWGASPSTAPPGCPPQLGAWRGTPDSSVVRGAPSKALGWGWGVCSGTVQLLVAAGSPVSLGCGGTTAGPWLSRGLALRVCALSSEEYSSQTARRAVSAPVCDLTPTYLRCHGLFPSEVTPPGSRRDGKAGGHSARARTPHPEQARE